MGVWSGLGRTVERRQDMADHGLGHPGMHPMKNVLVVIVSLLVSGPHPVFDPRRPDGAAGSAEKIAGLMPRASSALTRSPGNGASGRTVSTKPNQEGSDWGVACGRMSCGSYFSDGEQAHGCVFGRTNSSIFSHWAAPNGGLQGRSPSGCNRYANTRTCVVAEGGCRTAARTLPAGVALPAGA